MKVDVTGALYLLAAAICWSTGGLLIKLIDLDPVGLAGARSAIAGVLIWLYSRRFRPVLTKQLVFGAVAYAGTVILFVVATKTTTAANAILLQYTAPIWVALLSPWLLKESISGVDWLAVILTLGGMGVFFLEDLSVAATAGNLYAVASGIFFALCILSLRMGRDGSAIHMVLFGNLITAVVCGPFVIGNHFPSEDILPLILLGVGQLGLGYILFTKGIARVTALEGVLIPVLEPLLNPVWVLLFVGEVPSIHAVIGGAVVLVTVTGRALHKAREREEQSEHEAA